MSFRLPLAFVQLGPEMGTRLDVTAVFRRTLSFRGALTEDAAQAADLFPHPSVLPCDCRIPTSPHGRSLHAPRGPGTRAPSGVGAEHTWVGTMPPAQVALRGSQQTQLQSIPLVVKAQWTDARRGRKWKTGNRELRMENRPIGLAFDLPVLNSRFSISFSCLVPALPVQAESRQGGRREFPKATPPGPATTI